jgi:hypothetical protein
VRRPPEFGWVVLFEIRTEAFQVAPPS